MLRCNIHVFVLVLSTVRSAYEGLPDGTQPQVGPYEVRYVGNDGAHYRGKQMLAFCVTYV